MDALEDPLEEALSRASDGIVIDDDANIRRVKALAATVPIEDLDRTKAQHGVRYLAHPGGFESQ